MQQQHMVAACKPPHAVRRAALPLPGPSLRRAFPCNPARAREAVRTRCQEEKQSGDGGEKKKQQEQEKRTFLSLEEAGLVEMSGLSTHERFLCRLTISSLNLLRVISEQEGVAMEELNAGRVCDWFLKDKLKREQNLDTAVLHQPEERPFVQHLCRSSPREMRRFCSVPRGRRPSAPHGAGHPPPEWIEPYTDLADPSPYTAASVATPTPSPWLPRVVSLVLRAPPATLAADLRAFCRTFLLRLSPAFVAAALRSPQLLPHPLPSLRFFRALPGGADDLAAHPQHLLGCYVSLLHSFARAREATPDAAGHARRLVAELRARGDGDGLLGHLTPPSAASLVRSLAALGLADELLWAWNGMRLAGVEPSRVTYNCLLDGLVNAGLLDTAVNVFDAMSTEDPVRPDVVSYNILIKGYCRAGRVQDAMARLDHMRDQAELSPDKITYLTLMQCHYSEGTFSQCVALFQEMEERGMGKDIPQHAYVLVIGALCKDGKPFEGMAVFERMLKRGCPAKAAMYTSLIDSMGKFGRETEAMSLFERMKSSGLELDAVTYGVIVNCLCRFGRLDEAISCFRSCEENGIAVNPIFYTSLIDGFGKAGMVDQAQELFKEMKVKGFVPDSYCYNVLIDGLAKAGRTDDACALYKRMEDDGCDQTVYTYTILIDGLFKEHKNEEALKLWDGMIDKGITPTAAAFRALANGLCLSGKYSRACRILDELAPMGVIPETAHEDMINALCRAGRFKQACKLADGIVGKGREIPGRVRTMMINALRKAGNTDLAVKLVHSKIGIGYERSGSIKRRVKFQTLFA
ncbi:hypothetical protein VPH35_024305 [Triticum aestivum]